MKMQRRVNSKCFSDLKAVIHRHCSSRPRPSVSSDWWQPALPLVLDKQLDLQGVELLFYSLKMQCYKPK